MRVIPYKAWIGHIALFAIGLVFFCCSMVEVGAEPLSEGGSETQLAMASAPMPLPEAEAVTSAQRVLDEACYGGDAWRQGKTESADDEARRIRNLKSWESFRDCPACPEMKVIPGGEFEMGAPVRSDGKKTDEFPRHRVTIRAFAVSRFELEWASFEPFVKETKRWAGESCRVLNEGNGGIDAGAGFNWAVPGYVQQPKHPAVCVSWEDAQAYVRWLSERTGKRYRLLSEAEWEYAARAKLPGNDYWGAQGKYLACVFGNLADQTTSAEISWNDKFPCSDRWWLASPSGTFRPNAYGLYDMLGNVWEWVEDCFNADYETASGDGRPRTCGQCDLRVIRGGSWGTKPAGVRFGNRAKAPQTRQGVNLGVRIARDLE